MSATICYLNTWKRFVNEGVLDSARLNNRITESWYRCKKEQVNPYLNKAQLVLSGDLLSIQKEKNAQLLDAATSHFARMSPAIMEAGMMALLVDADGYVLSLSGNYRTLEEARKINFIEGVRWTENEVGTNAIGTALQTREGIMINGTEHYSIASHKWSCAAMPIFNEEGQMLGVIDVSCPVDRSHPFMLGMVASIAYAIEREIAFRFSKRELALFEQSVELAEAHSNQFFVACNHKDVIIAASKLVRNKVPQSIGMSVHEFLRNGYRIETQTPLRLKEDSAIMGKCVFLAEQTLSNNMIFPVFSPEPFYFRGELGVSESFQATIKKIKLVAPTDSNVCITGETGTGKELVARALHENSSRKNGPFIALNCGSLPKELMQSELFGYVEGAFTGAKKRGYKGKFEQANQGTIFLDEIGEIPPAMQVALLRVLQERVVVPIGGTNEIPLDIRIITATHRNLAELVNKGLFRQDLYYRLNVYPIALPSLRERKEDIPHLVRYFCQKNNWNIPFTDKLINPLKQHHWPGNIRELLNTLERMHILLSDGRMELNQLLDSLFVVETVQESDSPSQGELKEMDDVAPELKIREKIQRQLMLDALKKTKGNVTAAAKFLDIPRSTFYKRLQKFGL
ncbi:sigma-54-dependent Fis family transcriptional regulator [Aneurinibacillus sp. Ricciae_BoGa-3]|uniref:sigma-54-dependent Fis family transcriptional regulator n=1 Tax=Aneurinibacillus sp. Ricciae_BoGa-3 TaxID=3022697 RepID=UPI00233FAD21|nr:sigma-54-dependent Fis family transcriptional regulator [Aneurinibacillus sp. Ricciae_BoGa-3]WCK56638.1 sigma-54-dependent Fis family transcriptional regulator [Aneurinibacillus sp. Ricciae_BoGa-3]